ncbi:MAG: TrbG/VirB9 family P-type conjugative transfer protein [Rhizomicrobium sp.]
MIRRGVIGVGAAIVFGGGVFAHPAALSARIKTIEFAENTTVVIEGCTNFQTTVIFDPDEKIENVGLGDANQWQVMPNKRADLLFVKPLVAHAFSNMTVVTPRRVYNFELRSAPQAACRGGRVVYTLRFHYLDVPAKASASAGSADLASLLPPPEKRNSAYTYSGDTPLVPFRVFDDGKSTFFLWEKGVATPAIYVVGSDDKESLVNYSNHGEYVVVDLVGKGFMLRRGDQSAKLYNDAFVVPKLDAQSPQPAEKPQHSSWPF